MIENIWIVWFVFSVILMIIEIFTPSFLFGLFSAGAFLTALFAFFYPKYIYIQLLIFAIISFLFIIFVRKLIIKLFFKDKGTTIKTNADALIGRVFKAYKTINDEEGAIMINDVFWKARTKNNTVIKKGEKVKIIDIDSTILIVEKVDE